MTKNNEFEDEEYYIINLEQISNEDSLLFWKPNESGYTANITEAGIYSKERAEEINKHYRDIAFTKTQLYSLGVKEVKLLRFNLDNLREMKKQLKE